MSSAKWRPFVKVSWCHHTMPVWLVTSDLYIFSPRKFVHLLDCDLSCETGWWIIRLWSIRVWPGQCRVLGCRQLIKIWLHCCAVRAWVPCLMAFREPSSARNLPLRQHQCNQVRFWSNGHNLWLWMKVSDIVSILTYFHNLCESAAPHFVCFLKPPTCICCSGWRQLHSQCSTICGVECFKIRPFSCFRSHQSPSCLQSGLFSVNSLWNLDQDAKMFFTKTHL